MRLSRAVPAAILWLFLLVIVLFGPVLSPHDPAQTGSPGFASPGVDHVLGTDNLGRDILSRFLWGGRNTAGGALLASLVAILLGFGLSLPSLLDVRLLDRAIGYMLDVLLAFPGLLVALIIVALLGTGITQVALAVGLSLAPTFARLARGAAASVKTQPYIGASRALGADRLWVMRKHILGNVMPQLVSSAAILLAWALLDIAALEFIGLAGSPEVPTWGSMIGVGRAYIREAPWLVAAPGLALSASVLGFMLLSNITQVFDRGRG